jgi:hypothetical protein
MSTVSYCEYVGKGVKEATWGHSFVLERQASRMAQLGGAYVMVATYHGWEHEVSWQG